MVGPEVGLVGSVSYGSDKEGCLVDVSSVTMSGALSAALTGMQQQYDRFGTAVENIATGEGDFLRNVIEMKSAETALKFNLAAAKTALDMQDAAIDLLV
jgi:hypothetical protein